MEYIGLTSYGQRNETNTIAGYALVDDEDYEYLRRWKWNLNKDNYAYRVEQYTGSYGQPLFTMMHREIMRQNSKNIRGLVVDHKDGDRLNNQKSNLRICNAIQNCQNKKHKPTKDSPYKGVIHLKGIDKYRASINLDLGTYPTAEEASATYNEMAIEIYGEYANLN